MMNLEIILSCQDKNVREERDVGGREDNGYLKISAVT